MTVKERVAAVSLAASLVLAIAKLAIGLAIGSLALITDALHSASDFLATAMTFAAVRFGDRPADESHPYGHGKFENVAALGETTLLLLLAGGVTVEAVRRLAAGGEAPALSWLAVAVLLVEIAVNGWRARELARVGRDTGSAALVANSLHFSTDVLSSLAVLAGFALIALGQAWGDAAAAIAVAVLVAVLALRLLKRTLDDLVDRAPPGMAAALQQRVARVPGVIAVDFVRLRPVGPRHFVDAGVQIARSLGMEQAAAVKNRVAAAARDLLGEAEVVVQTVPVSPSDETVQERVALVALRERLAVHHLTVQRVDGQLALALDLEVDDALPLAAAHAVADRLEAAIRAEFGADTEIEVHIEPLTPEFQDAEPGAEAARAAMEAVLQEAAGLIDGLSDIHDVRLRKSRAGHVLVAHCRLDPDWTVATVHDKVDALERAVRDRRPDIARIVVHAEPRRDAADLSAGPASPPS